MTSLRWTGAPWLALLLIAAVAPVGAASQPPVEAFGNLPEYSYPALSPDGKHFAVVRAVKGRRAVAISQVDAPEGSIPALIDVPGGSIGTIAWANNNRLIIVVKANVRGSGDDRLRTWWRAFSVDAQGRNLAALLGDSPTLSFNVGAATIADLDLEDADHVYMPLVAGGVFNSVLALHLYRVDVNTGKSELFQPGTMWTADWIMDGKGRVVARVDNYARELKYHIKVPDGSDFREVAAFDLEAGGTAHVSGVSDDGKALVMQLPSPSRTGGLYRLDLTTRATTPIYFNEQYDVAYALKDDWTGRVIGAAYFADKTEYLYFDPAREKLQKALERAFAGRTVSIQSCDVAQHACIFAVEGPREPPVYYFLDVSAMHASVIGSTYPKLAKADLGEMRSYPYAARDGLHIPAYLTLPPDREAKRLPLVVMPHGGPEIRDLVGFNWWAQFLANRGYAVLQSNFRGSGGYGAAFTAAGYREWGLRMETDLADGVAKLVADGIADPKRVCILGASYGGYAALAGAAFTPDVYACAISVSGISDLEALLHSEEDATGRDSSTMSYWRSRLGDRHNSDDVARLGEVSPALHADRINIPVLLMHGANDTTVPIAQSTTMRDALLAAHRNVQFVTLEGDDHYLDLADTRIRVLSEIEKFLDATIGH